MPYDVEAIRKRLKASTSGKFVDPDEFKPEKAKSATEPIKYVFYILPPYARGDKIKGGVAKDEMLQFFIKHAAHWVNERPNPCPRVWESGDCDICTFGFDLLKDEKIKSDDAKKQAVLKQWMPTQQFIMNIFFPNLKANPEELRGRVMFFNAPKTVIDICGQCLLRDGPGDDPESPEAYGVFYDENNANLFELQVVKQGRSNSYKTSKFRPTTNPMVRNPDNSPNQAAITQLLNSRHDLFSKIEVPDLEKLSRVYQIMVNGDDSASDGKGGGFDSDENAAAPATTAPAGKLDPGKGTTKVTSKATASPKAKPIVEDEDVVDQHVASDALSAEAPDEEVPPPVKPTTTKTTTKPTTTKTTPVVAKTEEATEENKKAVNSLLSQLDDED